LDDRIAGEFTGNFSNGGERIVLLDAQGQSLRDFTYFDTSPWPSAADGDGPSLLLKDPWQNPDHADPMNWTVSATPGGVPGGSPLWLSYQAWRELWWGPTLALNDWVSGPASDPEGDGLSNYAEYVLGLDPHRPSDVPTASANVLLHNGALHLVVSLELSGGASEGRLTWEVSSDLSSWAPPTSSFTVFGVQPGWDGRTTMTFVDPEPLDARSARFVRPSITGP